MRCSITLATIAFFAASTSTAAPVLNQRGDIALIRLPGTIRLPETINNIVDGAGEIVSDILYRHRNKRGIQALDETIDSAGGAIEGIVGTVGGTLAQTAGAVESVVVNGAGTVFAGLSGGGIGGTVAQGAGAVESVVTNDLGTGFAGVGGLLGGGGRT